MTERAFDIYRIPVDGGEAEDISGESGDEFQPDLSPDGRELAFHSWRTGSRDIFVKSLTGGAAEQVTRTGAHEAGPVWSPDGNAIAFWTIGGDRSVNVVRRDAGGRWGVPRSLGGTSTRPDWLPNGDLAFASERRLAIAPAGGGPVRIVYTPPDGGDISVDWIQVRPDGRMVYFKTTDSEGRASIWSVPIAGGAASLLVTFDDLSRPSMRNDFASDGKRFFFALDDRQSDIWVADIATRRVAR